MTQSTPSADAGDNQNERSADIPATNPFQRPGQPAQPALNPRVGGNYMAYPAYGSPSSPIAAGAESNKRRLLIGEGITMSGEIESCDHLIVEGTVEAALKGANILEISEKGMFYGTVEINEATIAGKFEGELTVNGRLTVRGSGSVTGAVTYKELAVEAGATIDGKLSPVGGKGASSEKKSPKGKSSDFSSKAEELPILQRAAQ
jgi:cytoskeletal protein CcmA (bactofilin family)